MGNVHNNVDSSLRCPPLVTGDCTSSPPAIVKVTQGAAAKLGFIAFAKHMELHTITTPRLFYHTQKLYVRNMTPAIVGCYT